MKRTYIIYAIFVFAVIMSVTLPRITMIVYKNSDQVSSTYETQNKNQLAKAVTPVSSTAKVANKASKVELAIATPIMQEAPKEEVKEEPKQVVQEQKQTEQVTSIDSIAAQLNKMLKSNLTNTGILFAKYSNQYGVDPYLATAIALHETGCNWSCSAAVKNKNNVGGMMSGGSLIYFNTLESGIESFIKNIKTNYYDHGLNTPELMNKKYAANPNWHVKINNYINKLKAA